MTRRDANLPPPSRSELRALPKVELHLHLEGAMPLAAIHELACKYDTPGDAPEWQRLVSGPPYRDLIEFDRLWHWKNTLIRDLEDVSLIGRSSAARLRDDGVVYAEASFCPSDFADRSYTAEQLLDAVRRGIDQVPGIDVALIIDLGRERGPRHAADQVRLAAAAMRSHGVVGIGMGGVATPWEPEAFAGVYAEARRLGLRTTVHSGEVDGPDEILRAVRALRPDRIGHGTRAAESAALVARLARDQIPLEVCPSSNVHTGVVPGFSHHPARRFHDSGIPISLNTDDPVMFGTTLSAEYEIAATLLGFPRQELHAMMASTIAASWMTEDRKARRRRQLEDALVASAAPGAAGA